MSTEWAIGVNINRCIQCWACISICRMENEVPLGQQWIRVAKAKRGSFPKLEMYFFPIMCQHCQNPPCTDACPRGAIAQREDGVVLIDRDNCDGCLLCIDACPYRAIVFNPQRETAEKCTLCSHRLDAGKRPACVEACQVGALVFGDLSDPKSEIASFTRGDSIFPLLKGEGTEPRVRYHVAAHEAREWLASEQF